MILFLEIIKRKIKTERMETITLEDFTNKVVFLRLIIHRPTKQGAQKIADKIIKYINDDDIELKPDNGNNDNDSDNDKNRWRNYLLIWEAFFLIFY